jgi:exopolyphosphatase/guanosine-5'-triphosphate,3'-diphosphate pyrophosphatase
MSQRATAVYEKIVKTADMLDKTGVIHHEAVDRVIYAISEAKQKIDFEGQTIRAVTTEAIRRAENADAVLERISKETGICFEVIDGEEEAVLTLLAVEARLQKLHYASKCFVMIDIGGGSTEVVLKYPQKVFSKSFPVGIVTIAQKYGTLDKIRKVLYEEMLAIQMFVAEIYATQGEVDSLVATAGTPTTVAAMKLGQTYASYDASRINGTTLEKEELSFYLNRLLSLSLEEREEAVGTGRSDLIAAGILILEHLYEITGFDRCIVVDDGLREGVALAWCSTY